MNKVKTVNKNQPDYKDKLLSAFPDSIHKDLKKVLEVIPFTKSDIEFWEGMTYKEGNTISITLNGEKLELPYRIYLKQPEVDKIEQLTPIQKEILYCIYSRHNDGHVRQSALEVIAESKNYWTTPFKIQLLAEYILPILELLEANLDNTNIDNYKKFILENEEYWELTKQRVISYWNVYYRNDDINNYAGWRIVNKLDMINT